ncbi:MAG: ParB N-terminal domain-containing protein [Syntrophobacteraceae bacterium]|jgi:ParB family chromosome partitioning protein
MVSDIREIELGKISPNLRIICSAECIEEIVRCIKRQGQVEPIQISFEHDSFRIMDGEKRWRACKKLGIRTIRAVIA